MEKGFAYICKKYFFWILVISSLITTTGCALVYNPATQRKEIVIIDTDHEIQLGQMLKTQIEGEHKLSQDEEIKTRLERIGSEVANYSDRQDLKYFFQAIIDKELNAFATPGGFIYVHTATLEKATDDELACVLAHEIGHIAARHPVKRLEANLGTSVLLSLILGRLSNANYIRILDTMLGLISLGYSREDERFADKLGVKYAYKAGFEPEAMISFFNKLLEKKKTQLEAPLILRSHPYLEERIENVHKEIEGLKNQVNLENTQSQAIENHTKKLHEPEQNLPTQNHKEVVPQNKGFCALCNKTYSSQYNYCPYHGTNLR